MAPECRPMDGIVEHEPRGPLAVFSRGRMEQHLTVLAS